jgi:hypothetical protein
MSASYGRATAQPAHRCSAEVYCATSAFGSDIRRTNFSPQRVSGTTNPVNPWDRFHDRQVLLLVIDLLRPLIRLWLVRPEI